MLNGGAVRLTGAMNLASGVLIDVSGASGVIDNPQHGRGSDATVSLASDGGEISLRGGTLASSSIAASLQARAGGPGAAGGRLRIYNPSLAGAGNVPSSNLFDAISLIGANGMNVTASIGAINGGGFSAINISTMLGLMIGSGAVMDVTRLRRSRYLERSLPPIRLPAAKFVPVCCR